MTQRPQIRIELSDSGRRAINEVLAKTMAGSDFAKQSEAMRQNIAQMVLSDSAREAIEKMLADMRPVLEKARVVTEEVREQAVSSGMVSETAVTLPLTVVTEPFDADSSARVSLVDGPLIVHLGAFGTILTLVQQTLRDQLQGQSDEYIVTVGLYVTLLILDFLRRQDS